MAEATENLAHPDFGTLTWRPKESIWAARVPNRAGGELDVIVDPGDGDRFEFLSRAAELFRWAMANERGVLAEAMADELLELYNDDWCRRGQPKLTADGLAARLEWQLLDIKASEVIPVEFSYFAGELFGRHVVTVSVDETLQYMQVDLRG